MVRASLYRAEGHLVRGEWLPAARALSDALPHAEQKERVLLLGLRHLAVAGFRREDGDRVRARRQLDRARRRLAPFVGEDVGVDVGSLLWLVSRGIEP
ncbi:MAG: hypothetical protein C4306_03120 [Thermoleophilia bacterium]